MKADEQISNEIAIEIGDGEVGTDDFELHNTPACQNGDEIELDASQEEDFLRRYEELTRLITEPFVELSNRGEAFYGETTTFSEAMKVRCSGKFVFGPQYVQMIGAFILKSAPVVVLSAVFRDDLPVLLHVLTWASWFLTSVLLFLTSSNDPGIVPKRMSTLQPAPPRVRLFVNDKETEVRYCTTCDIYRGPRTHHCWICGNCVDQYDHHCPWTGTCIGAKNYHMFLGYLHTLHVLILFVFIDSTVAPVNRSVAKNIGMLHALGELYYIPLVLMAFVFLAGVSVTGLMLFHWFLLSRNLTTAEYLKSTFVDLSQNPWDIGTLANICAKWTGWVDPKTYSRNYRCFVVRELVKREVELLSQERDEELRLHGLRQQEHVNRNSVNSATPVQGDAIFAQTATGLYI